MTKEAAVTAAISPRPHQYSQYLLSASMGRERPEAPPVKSSQ